ncbi:hypothetical protein BV898_07817 [Hypsibius exemplaris]|uniref:Homeobox domain-containing protein n=1 Tax=Hypsibius exemplaris TaxID=2072580 RepID=A0A1W0WS69_HYPEX|nr:hypothetical protein BV898_07817 [Hypsibius exemplaris]
MEFQQATQVVQASPKRSWKTDVFQPWNNRLDCLPSMLFTPVPMKSHVFNQPTTENQTRHLGSQGKFLFSRVEYSANFAQYEPEYPVKCRKTEVPIQPSVNSPIKDFSSVTTVIKQTSPKTDYSVGDSTLEGAGKKPRPRTTFTVQQMAILEQHFRRQAYISGTQRLELARALNLSEAQVKVWWQNRRIKERKVLTRAGKADQPEVMMVAPPHGDGKPIRSPHGFGVYVVPAAPFSDPYHPTFRYQ